MIMRLLLSFLDRVDLPDRLDLNQRRKRQQRQRKEPFHWGTLCSFGAAPIPRRDGGTGARRATCRRVYANRTLCVEGLEYPIVLDRCFPMPEAGGKYANADLIASAGQTRSAN